MEKSRNDENFDRVIKEYRPIHKIENVTNFQLHFTL